MRLFIAIALLAATAVAEAAPPAGGQPVQLPTILRDDRGGMWDVQYDGSIGDGGNDLYDGGGRLFVDNQNQYNTPTQQALLDPARGEVVMPPMQMGPVIVSRRVSVLKALGGVRFVEVIENHGAAAAKVQLRVYFNMGGSVQQAIPLVDDRRARQPVGYAIGDQSNAVAMIGGGRGAKALPRFEYQQNNDNVNLFYDVDVPARGMAVVVHCQVRRPTAPAAAEAWRAIRDKDLVADLPREIRKRVVNFPGGDAFVGDLEVLRGDAGRDVVELRGGDAYRGQLLLDGVRIQTVYGPVTVSPDAVVCILNVGAFRPTQLVVTADGDVLGGRLIDTPKLKLRMTSGQVTEIPIGQVTRVGFRRRPGEPEDWDFDNKRVAYLRTGERLRIKPLPGDLELATSAGPVRISPAMIASVVLVGEDVAVPEVRLVDGSRLSGLLTAPAYDLPLAASAAHVTIGGGVPSLGQAMTDQRARVPAAAMGRLQLAPERDVEPLAPTLALANNDTLVGQLTGTLTLETKFDTIRIDGAQVKGLCPAVSKKGDRGAGLDVQVTLWDDSTLSGRLAESHVTCRLRCGMVMRVPVALVGQYVQPLPEPSPNTAEQIRRIAADLDADDYAVRRAAQARIHRIGPPALSILKSLERAASPEARSRIEVLTRALVSQLDGPPAPGALGTSEEEMQLQQMIDVLPQ